jgi:hypothetical protein
MAFRTRKDTKIALIKQVPLFASLGKAQLAQVASIADELDLPEGTVLTRQGDRGREFFVLIDGGGRGAPQRQEASDYQVWRLLR